MRKHDWKHSLIGVALAASAPLAWADEINREGLNLPRGVTEFSSQVYDLHMLILWICVVIGIGVFGAMFYSMFAHRKSRGAVAAQFSHSTKAEVAWTVIPILILVFMAVPATKTLIDMEQTADSELTVKITGFQWGWKYEYVEDEIGFVSMLDRQSNRARLKGSDIDPRTLENYLIDVDNPLVLPTDTKVRFVITADDVIHSWWVPALGWKRDAIPGLVNEAWTNIKKAGTYRGQCAELCGKDHGFMPVVVIAKPKNEFKQWVAAQKGQMLIADDEALAANTAVAPAPAAAVSTATVPAAALAVAATTVVDSTASVEDLMTKGKTVYEQRCGTCHQPTGLGLPPAFPALAGSEFVTGEAAGVIDVLLNGREGTSMVPFNNVLSDEEIAAAVTYIRNSFGNATDDAVQAGDVAAAKQG